MKLTPEFRDRLNELIEARKLSDAQCQILFRISHKALHYTRTLGRYSSQQAITRIEK